MRGLVWVGVLAACVAGTACAPTPEEPPPTPRVTTRAGGPAATKARPAPKTARGGFEFTEKEGAAAQQRIADPKRRLAPSMDELELQMRVQGANQRPQQRWVCERCGVEARESGRCCGGERVPVR